jgi:hypothetical protein
MCTFQGIRDKRRRKKETINGDKPPYVVVIHRTEEKESLATLSSIR